MAFCPDCGAVLSSNAMCLKCGTAVPIPETTLTESAPSSRVEVSRRLLAGAIDLVPAVLLLAIIAYFRTRIGFAPRATATAVTLIPFVFILLRDALRGRSPGKLILGLQVLQRDTREPAGVPESVLRNAPIAAAVLLLPTGPFGMFAGSSIVAAQVAAIVATGRGLSDRMGGTEVRYR